jgi:hypothetical protein
VNHREHREHIRGIWRLPENPFPLPWREGIKGRGNRKLLKIHLFFHPHLALPRPRDELGICDKGEGIISLSDSLHGVILTFVSSVISVCSVV